MTEMLHIAGRCVGKNFPVYVIAEVSANHNRDYEQAVRILHAAKDAGADAVKLQTYTADTITLASEREEFRVSGGTLWDGRTLHDLYAEAFMPWEWQPRLKEVAEDLGMDCFSSAFDSTAVDFLEKMNVPAHKDCIIRIGGHSTHPKDGEHGQATDHVNWNGDSGRDRGSSGGARHAGADEIALLKCTSAYPAPAHEMNLRTIPEMARRFGVPVGLSDHSMGIAVPVAAVALGACIIEKHLTLSRSVAGPDSAFSLEPQEFKAMVDAVWAAEKSLGEVRFGLSEKEDASRAFAVRCSWWRM